MNDEIIGTEIINGKKFNARSDGRITAQGLVLKVSEFNNLYGLTREQRALEILSILVTTGGEYVEGLCEAYQTEICSHTSKFRLRGADSERRAQNVLKRIRKKVPILNAARTKVIWVGF